MEGRFVPLLQDLNKEISSYSSVNERSSLDSNSRWIQGSIKKKISSVLKRKFGKNRRQKGERNQIRLNVRVWSWEEKSLSHNRRSLREWKGRCFSTQTKVLAYWEKRILVQAQKEVYQHLASSIQKDQYLSRTEWKVLYENNEKESWRRPKQREVWAETPTKLPKSLDGWVFDRKDNRTWVLAIRPTTTPSHSTSRHYQHQKSSELTCVKWNTVILHWIWTTSRKKESRGTLRGLQQTWVTRVRILNEQCNNSINIFGYGRGGTSK